MPLTCLNPPPRASSESLLWCLLDTDRLLFTMCLSFPIGKYGCDDCLGQRREGWVFMAGSSAE